MYGRVWTREDMVSSSLFTGGRYMAKIDYFRLLIRLHACNMLMCLHAASGAWETNDLSRKGPV